MKDKMIDEGEYTQGVKAPSTRAVIVVDRGWIFCTRRFSQPQARGPVPGLWKV